MTELNNNLKNVKNKDPIFRRLSDFILEHALEPEDWERLDMNLLSIIAGDSYFTFYSFMPTVEEKNDNPVLEVVRKFISEYISNSKFEKTHNMTRLDHEMSMVYSISFMKELLKLIKQDQKLASSFNKQRKIVPRVLPSTGSDQQAADRLLKALEKAAERASKTTKNARDIRSYLQGSQAGKKPGSFEKLLNLANLVTNVYGAERILSMAREITQWAPKFTTVKKVKSRFGDEVGGYRISRDPSKATPKEIALLNELFEYKMAIGMISREKQYPTIGGYYVLVDKSGSMLGPKTVWARSVALSLLKISMRAKTRYYLRFFDTQTYPDHPIVEPEEALEYLVTVWSDGGTDIDRAIVTACKDMVEGVKDVEKYTNTIVVITDGQDEVDGDQVREALEMANAQLVSVMVQGDNSSLKKVSHQYFRASLDVRGALRLVEAVR